MILDCLNHSSTQDARNVFFFSPGYATRVLKHCLHSSCHICEDIKILEILKVINKTPQKYTRFVGNAAEFRALYLFI